jgi:hypothetical protein
VKLKGCCEEYALRTFHVGGVWGFDVGSEISVDSQCDLGFLGEQIGG